jgi:hypothetical protein
MYGVQIVHPVQYLTEKQYFSGTFKAEVQRTEVQESFLAEVGNVQLGLEDSATSGKLGKDNLPELTIGNEKIHQKKEKDQRFLA